MENKPKIEKLVDFVEFLMKMGNVGNYKPIKVGGKRNNISESKNFSNYHNQIRLFFSSHSSL